MLPVSPSYNNNLNQAQHVYASPIRTTMPNENTNLAIPAYQSNIVSHIPINYTPSYTGYVNPATPTRILATTPSNLIPQYPTTYEHTNPYQEP